jgi:hypothetical protein
VVRTQERFTARTAGLATGVALGAATAAIGAAPVLAVGLGAATYVVLAQQAIP